MIKKNFFQKKGLAGYKVTTPNKQSKEFSTLEEAKNYAKKNKVARIFKISYLLDYYK